MRDRFLDCPILSKKTPKHRHDSALAQFGSRGIHSTADRSSRTHNNTPRSGSAESFSTSPCVRAYHHHHHSSSASAEVINLAAPLRKKQSHTFRHNSPTHGRQRTERNRIHSSYARPTSHSSTARRASKLPQQTTYQLQASSTNKWCQKQILIGEKNSTLSQ